MRKARTIISLLAVALLVGCTNKKDFYGLNEKVPMDVNFSEKTSYKVGILQPVEHNALGKARDGFIKGLADKGFGTDKVEFVYQNAGGEASLITSYATSLVMDCDLVLGIGTGAAQALKAQQFSQGTKKPILFTAVTDAVDGDLVKTNEEPGGYVTGTSDAQPVDAQIALIKQCIPTVKKIGVVYTQTEENSQVQARQAAEAASKLDIDVSISTCTNKNDIQSALDALTIKGIQALYIPTDNNVAANMAIVKGYADQNNILVVAGEEGMLTTGGHITLSVDYTNLGHVAGEMAASILSGEKTPNQIPVQSMKAEQCVYVYSSNNVKDSQITIPQEVLDVCTDINAGE